MKLNLKKSLFVMPLVIGLIGGTITSVKAAGESSAVYRTYTSSKVEDNNQFDFEGTKPANVVKLDGKKDSVYTTPFLTYGGASQKSVNAYSYHDTDSLYLLFEVSDTNVLYQATNSNSAYNEDGIEIYIDPLADGGTSPRSDDIQLNLGISGFSRRLKGTGTGWKSNSVYLEYEVSYMADTTPNDETDVDKGYYLEVKIPFGILGVTNQSPICCAFAHADLNHLGDTRKWYGLSGRTDDYAVSSTAIPDSYLILSKNNKLYNKGTYANSLVSNPSICGRVTDGNKAVENAKVTMVSSFDPSVSEVIYTATDGSYYFDNVSPSYSYTLTISKSGYISYSYTVESDLLAKCMSSICSKEVIIHSNRANKVEVKGSIKTLGGNALNSFNVTLDGEETPVITNNSGEYTMKIYENCENKILINKEGFEQKSIELTAQQSIDNYVIETVEIFPSLFNLGTPDSSDSSSNSATVYANNYSEGLVFKAETSYEIEGDDLLEMYLNTGDTGFNGNFVKGDFKFVYGNSVFSVYEINEETKDWTLNEELSKEVKIYKEEDVILSTYFLIPASVYGKAISDTVGVAYRFNNGSTYETTTTNAVPDNTISYLDTSGYLRLDGTGSSFISFRNNNEDFKKEVYYLNNITGASSEAIPENADKFYIYSCKDENEVKFDIYVDDGFGIHNNASTKISGIECLNMILDIDDYKQTAWAMNQSGQADKCYDINLRVYSDGTICYLNSKDFTNGAANQLWWSDSKHTNGTSTLNLDAKYVDPSKYVVEEFAGGRKFSLHFTYSELAEMGGAPDKVITSSKNISFGAWEASETSKTTIRFYSTDGSGCYLLSNKKINAITGPLSSQSGYVVIKSN